MILDARLFTGLSLPPDVLKNFDELLTELQPLARIRWSPIWQLHITTKFIGTWPSNRVPEMCRLLDRWARVPKFSLTLTGLRYFAMPSQGWVLYAKVEPSDGLNDLAAVLDNLMSEYGIRRSLEEFLPHMTIARIPGNNPWPELDERVEQYSTKPFGTFEVNEYHLYESTPSGYRQIASIPLS
jgi:RNA 2',3'-cyclic 3'-phosphodiesterase